MQDHEQERHEIDPVIRLNSALTHWLASAATLYHLFRQLSTYLGSETLSQTICSTTGWVGQCPIHQLLDLQDNMRDELAKLSFEMHRTGTQSIASRCETLTDHTLRLESINQQAIVLLRLASLSAS